MTLSLPPDVAGLSLDGAGPYVISVDENRELCATMGLTPEADGRAHPIYYFIATQVGMGKTVAGLCEACAFDVNDGPMMAGTKVEFARPLKTGEPYRVRGEIVALTRKQSRKLGVMDVVDYRLRLEDAAGEEVLVAANTWVLPRRSLA